MRMLLVAAAGLLWCGAANADPMFVNDIKSFQIRSDKAEISFYGQKYTGEDSEIHSQFKYSCEGGKASLELYVLKNIPKLSDADAPFLLGSKGRDPGERFGVVAFVSDDRKFFDAETEYREANKLIYKVLVSQIDAGSGFTLKLSKQMGGVSDADRERASYSFKFKTDELATRVAAGLDAVRNHCDYTMKQ